MYPYIIQDTNITIFIDGNVHTIDSSSFTYKKLLKAITENDWAAVPNVVCPKKLILEYGNNCITIEKDTLYWKGVVLDNSLTRRILEMLANELPVEPLVLFMENLMENPSSRAVNELYSFLENNNLPITSDGYFLAFKKINEDWTDVHSRTVPNKPASAMTADEISDLENNPVTCGKFGEVTVSYIDSQVVVELDRNRVDDNSHVGCSNGLHVCSLGYLSTFCGERIIITKVNPKDVVSVPIDSTAKIRVCKYTVVSELGVPAESAFTSVIQDDANQLDMFEV